MGGGEEMFRLTSYIYSLYIVRVHGWRGGDVSVNVVYIYSLYIVRVHGWRGGDVSVNVVG